MQELLQKKIYEPYFIFKKLNNEQYHKPNRLVTQNKIKNKNKKHD